MTEVILAKLNPASDFAQQFYAANSAKVMGMKNERNPFALYAAPMMLSRGGGDNRIVSAIGETPISISAVPGSRITLYHDLNDDPEFAGYGTSGAHDYMLPNRSSLSLSALALETSRNFFIDDEVSDAHLAVNSPTNIAHRFSLAMSGAQGDIALAAMTAMRGTEKVWSINKNMIDKPGENWAKTASSPFMDMINQLQKHAASADPQQSRVRPRRLNWYAGLSKKIEGPRADWSDYPSSFNADYGPSWNDLYRIRAELDGSHRNSDIKELPFQMARINSVRARGSEEREDTGDSCVMFVRPEVATSLALEASHVSAQESLTTAIGLSAGLWSGKIGKFRGWHLQTVAKLPVHETSDNKRIAVNLLLGKGALMILHNTRRRSLPFGATDNAMLRRFSECYSPVKVRTWLAETRGRQIGIGADLMIGAVVPAFKGSDNKLHEQGILAYHTMLEDL